MESFCRYLKKEIFIILVYTTRLYILNLALINNTVFEIGEKKKQL